MAKRTEVDRKDLLEEGDPAVDMARQVCYRFAALAFLDPRAGAWHQLRALRDDPLLGQATDLLRGLQTNQVSAVGHPESPSDVLDSQRVLAHLPSSEGALNTLYENTFGLLVSCNCPPYEMEYVNSKLTFQRSNTLADISGYYRAFGLTMSEQLPERPDHLVLELEFMATLIGLTHQAAQSHSPDAIEQSRISREAQERFLREHLIWWAPAFCKLLILQDQHGFYAMAGTFLTTFLAAERGRFGIPVHSGRVVPTLEERPESCEGCEISA